MKIEGLIKCPYCGSDKVYTYKYTEVSIWDDEFHEYLNNQSPDSDKLNCDTIAYRCSCKEENCKKYFTAKFRIKCEVEGVLMAKDGENEGEVYFKR